MSAAPLPQSPYKGLAPYDEADAQLFFGRERESRVIAANLLAARLTVVYAASGAGKSSVLRAGVLPYLRAEIRANIADTGRPELAIIQWSRWSAPDPLAELIAEIRAASKIESAPDASLADVVLAAGDASGGDVLIILDQFEEYFRYHGDNPDDPFAAQFPLLVTRSGLPARVVVAIREDELAALDRFKGRIPNLFGNYYRLKHLDRAAARLAIEGPLRVARGNGPNAIEPALVEALLDELAIKPQFRAARLETSDERGIEAPYLQLVLDRLWREELRFESPIMRLHTLERLGGARRVVRDHLRSMLATLPARDQAVAAQAFRLLVTPSGAKYAWNVADLAQAADVPRGRLQPVIDRLLDPSLRVLRPVAAGDGAPQVEIFHDVLAQEVQQWRAEWVQARERRRIWLMAGTALAVCLLIIAALAAPAIYGQYLRQQTLGLNPMIALGGGTAQLGAPNADTLTGEQLARQVAIAPFAMQQHEVTNAELSLCIQAGACTLWRPDEQQQIEAGAPDLPAVQVDAFQAAEFCRWLGGTLPTADQWERAARGLDGAAWPWREPVVTREYANIADPFAPDAQLAPVGRFAAGHSPEGLWDLIGNAMEWTRSQFPCSSEDCSWNPAKSTLDGLVLRGGSWRTQLARVTDPQISSPSFAEPEWGFRCVRE